MTMARKMALATRTKVNSSADEIRKTEVTLWPPTKAEIDRELERLGGNV
jgi:hypothetical protein